MTHPIQDVPGQTVINCASVYSDYFKGEVLDEMRPLLPEIDEIMRVLTSINKQIFSCDTFQEHLERMVEKGELDQEKMIFTPFQILDLLYRFDVIGNVVGSGHRIFKHVSPDSAVDFDKPLVVHVGLLDSLQIKTKRKAVPDQFAY